MRAASARGRPATWFGLGLLVASLLAPFWLIGMLGVLSDRRRRAWHDQLLRTDVRYTGARR